MLLPITTEVLVEEAERLGAGGHRYTSRQLYYAVCRAVERPAPSITGGLIGLGSILVLLAGALLFIHSVPISPVLAVLGVVVLLSPPRSTPGSSAAGSVGGRSPAGRSPPATTSS